MTESRYSAAEYRAAGLNLDSDASTFAPSFDLRCLSFTSPVAKMNLPALTVFFIPSHIFFLSYIVYDPITQISVAINHRHYHESKLKIVL